MEHFEYLLSLQICHVLLGLQLFNLIITSTRSICIFFFLIVRLFFYFFLKLLGAHEWLSGCSYSLQHEVFQYGVPLAPRLSNMCQGLLFFIEEVFWKLAQILAVLEFSLDEIAALPKVMVFIHDLVNLILDLRLEIKIFD